MPLLEKTAPALAAGGRCELPHQMIAEVFGGSCSADYNVQPDSEWFRVVFSAPVEDEPAMAETVLEPDEVTLERVSHALTRGRVVIAATGGQAERIMTRHRRDAFPPE